MALPSRPSFSASKWHWVERLPPLGKTEENCQHLPTIRLQGVVMALTPLVNYPSVGG